MLIGTQLRIYIVHHVRTLERRYRGLDDLDACNFSDVKEGWPGMVIDHVIIPGTKRVQSTGRRFKSPFPLRADFF